MIAAIIIIVIAFFVVVFIIGVISAWAETSEKIKRYNTPPPTNASSGVVDRYRENMKRGLYIHIFTCLSNGNSVEEISSNKYVIEAGNNAGMRVDNIQAIYQIKQSKEFLDSNNLYRKFSNLVELGYTDKQIAKQLIPRWAIFGAAYKPVEIQSMRRLLE